MRWVRWLAAGNMYISIVWSPVVRAMGPRTARVCVTPLAGYVSGLHKGRPTGGAQVTGARCGATGATLAAGRPRPGGCGRGSSTTP